MRIKYNYTVYPYSKKATDLSNLNGFLMAICGFLILPSFLVTAMTIYGIVTGKADVEIEFFHYVFLGCIIYFIFMPKFNRYIEKIAEEDRQAMARNMYYQNIYGSNANGMIPKAPMIADEVNPRFDGWRKFARICKLIYAIIVLLVILGGILFFIFG